MTIEDGKKIFQWPLEKREENAPTNEWHEVISYPTREACRTALRQVRIGKQVVL